MIKYACLCMCRSGPEMTYLSVLARNTSCNIGIASEIVQGNDLFKLLFCQFGHYLEKRTELFCHEE